MVVWLLFTEFMPHIDSHYTYFPFQYEFHEYYLRFWFEISSYNNKILTRIFFQTKILNLYETVEK